MKRAASEDAQDASSKKAKLLPVSLETLLDVSQLQTDWELQERFASIAHELCNNSSLRLYTNQNAVKFIDYNILEIEFYLIKEGHNDPFTHGADAQKIPGNWYFHKAPTRAVAVDTSSSSRQPTAAGGYRGGTRKGLDLTFGGPPGSDIRGGILLRSIRRSSTADTKLVSGPSLIVDELLAQSDALNIAALVAFWTTLRAFSDTAEGPRMVIGSRQNAQLPMYCTPRIGLDLYKVLSPPAIDDPRMVFIARPYRYLVQPEVLTANGRMHTFVGLYEDFLRNTNPQRALAKACELANLKAKTGEDYAQSYRVGKKSGNVTKFVGAKTSNPKAYIEMVGALRTFLSTADSEEAPTMGH